LAVDSSTTNLKGCGRDVWVAEISSVTASDWMSSSASGEVQASERANENGTESLRRSERAPYQQ
jgi:beta-mannanase